MARAAYLRKWLFAWLTVGMAALACGGYAETPQSVLQPAGSSPLATPLLHIVSTPTVALTQISPCVFPNEPAPIASALSLDAYSFSEPQIVLTHAATVGIVGWLSDSERLLIVQDIPKTNRQTIATFNTHSEELRLYAEREHSGAKPAWISVVNGIAFTSAIKKQGELWLNQDSPSATQRLASDLSSMFLGAAPDGQQLLYITGNQPQRLNVLSRSTWPARVNLSEWEYPSLEPWKNPGMYRMAWRPGTFQVVFYNNTYFFLVDVGSGQGCEVDLGKEKGEGGFQLWAVVTRWSPDGHYLAMLTAGGVPPVKRVDLWVLDMTTGKLTSMHPKVYTIPGQYYVMDVTWSPNSQTMAILATVEEKGGVQFNGLYLVNATTGETRRMLPQITFPGGDAGWGLAWSPDGNYLAITCLHGPLCLVNVTTQ